MKVEVGRTDKGVSIYQAERAYAIAKSFRPFIVVSPECSKSKKRFRGYINVYIKGVDRRDALGSFGTLRGVVLKENYKLLNIAKKVWSDGVWIENPYRKVK